MKFALATQELNYMIGKVLPVVSQKVALPILANILIEAKGNSIYLTATDLTVSIRCQTDAKVLEEGAITLPARRFASLLREITTMHVEIATNEEGIAFITAGESHFRLHGMGPEGFPDLPAMEGATKCAIDREVFREALYRTVFAVSRDDERPALRGMLLRIAGGEATLIGTDGKRLARHSFPLEIDASYEGIFVVPYKAIDEILKNTTEEEESVSLYLLKDKIAVETSSVRMVTKLLADPYPDVESIIPTEAETEVTINREELITLLRQVALFSDEEQQTVRFHFEEGLLHLDANAADVGEGKASMPCSYKGPQMQAAFNPRFMRDILDRSEASLMTIRLIDPFNPAILVDRNEEKEKTPASSLFLLMPMRM